MNDRRKYLRFFFVFTALAFWALSNMLSNSVFANIRPINVVRLVGLCMLFGGAIFSIVAYFRSRRSS